MLDMEEIIDRLQHDPDFGAKAAPHLARFRSYHAGEAPAPKLWLPEECSEGQELGMRVEMGFWFITTMQCSSLYSKSPEMLGRPVISVPSVFGGWQKGVLARTAHGDPPDLFQRLTLFTSTASGHKKLYCHGDLEVRKGQGSDMLAFRSKQRVKLNPQDAGQKVGPRIDS